MRRYAFFLPAALLCLVASCDSDVDGSESSRLTLLLTDAPGDFEAAVVTISQIYLQGSASEEEEGEAGDRVILLDEPVTTDLLTLANDVATLVDDAIVPAGTYGQLRFVIDGGYIEVETATGTKVYATPGYEEAPEQVDGTLQCPSCAQSGIKVNFAGGLRLDDDETLLVDFDVAETFGHQAGNSGMWIMRPSLKAASVAAAASIEVSVGLAAGVSLPPIGGQLLTLAGISVELKSVEAEEETTGELLVLADPDGDGTFTVRFLNVVPGEYTIALKAAGVTLSTTPGLPLTLEVGSGEDVTASLTITAASPAT
jgi:hypothetical protein